jgi:predicted pyridoxine 5'-phosphate oxidase superfamily flavin-nucleotide-binding protein
VSRHYGDLAFTDQVRDVQDRYGSRSFYDRQRQRGVARGSDPTGGDALTADVVDFLAEQDACCVATVSETGWPYVQFRGGPPGFLRVLGEHTVGWADFRGNLQYVTVGNLAGDARVALLVVDFAARRRLKVFGHARVAFADEEPDLVAGLALPDYEAVVERAVVVSVDAYDWNCPQHITPRFTLEEMQPALAGLRHRVAALEAENRELTVLLAARGEADVTAAGGQVPPAPGDLEP